MLFGTRVHPSKKFFTLAQAINIAAFNGNGQITETGKREFMVYQRGENQIILFAYYSSPFNSILQIEWRYKYYHNEVKHVVEVSGADKFGISEQDDLASKICTEMSAVVMAHIEKITPGILPRNF